MTKTNRLVTYFSIPGPDNTDELIMAVKNRLEETKISYAVIATTSGLTGLKLARLVKNKVKVIAISHQLMKDEYKREIKELGGITLELDANKLPLYKEGTDKIRATLYTLGQGFKVAVEVISLAADHNVVPLYKDIIGIGGTGTGADTAIIARATPTEEIFNPDKQKKLEIRELIAMPLEKKWWK